MASPELPFKTFRIENLPLTWTVDDLLAELHDADVVPVGQVSVARVPNTPYQSATVTLETEKDYRTFQNCNGKSRQLDTDMMGFTILSNGAEPGKSIDVIAITGLAGKAFMSWQSADGSMWLRDGIPQELENARVHIYGYKSTIQRSLSTAGLAHYTEEFSKLLDIYLSNESIQRPIILIGHSLGCLVIKKMLVDAHLRSRSTDLIKRIYSIFLFGAPHRGMENNKLRELTKDCWSENLVSDLSPGSGLLTELNENFAEAAAELKIVSCVELQPTPEPKASLHDPNTWKRTGPLKMIVDKDSACLYTQNEQIIEIDKNHSIIAKLSIKDSDYQRVLSALRSHSQEAVPYIAAKFDLQSSCSSLKMVLNVVELLPTCLESLGTRVKMRSSDFPTVLRKFGLFLRALQNFLEDKKARILFLEPTRQHREHGLVIYLRKAIQDLETNYLPYQKVASMGRAEVFSYGGTKNEWCKSIPFRYEHLFQPRTLCSHAEKSLRAMCYLKTILCLSVLHDQPVDLTTPTDEMQDVGLAHIISKHKALRAAGQADRTVDMLAGKLLPKPPDDNDPVRKSWDIRILMLSEKSILQNQQVMVEYRSYNFNSHHSILSEAAASQVSRAASEMKLRLARLAYVLQNLYTNREEGEISEYHVTGDSENCVLKCLGCLDDTSHERIALIFEIPLGAYGKAVDSGAMQTLYQYIQYLNQDRKAVRPTLRQRFELARTVCDSVLRLHCWGWLHKDIRSEHILTIIHSDSPLEYGSAEGDFPTATEIQPRFSSYLMNFEVARNTEDFSSLTVVDDVFKNFYRHPERQGNPERSTARHDWYAVGVVMLEIGLCRTVDALFAAHIAKAGKHKIVLSAKSMVQLLLDAARRLLPAVMGPCYADAVVKCLKGDFGVDDEADGTAGLCLRVQDTVLAAVEYGCQL